MKKIFLSISLLIYSSVFYAQNEASYWYFGINAGLRFNSANGQVSALTDGQISTTEGCTTISDKNGNLLFYTDGRTVWNRNHQVMPNGNYFGGTGLLGDPSSTSSGVIVPKPQDPDKYYIFTVDEPHHDNAAVYPNQFSGTYSDQGGGSVPTDDDGFNNGFNYSLVDMTLNGGLGDIDPIEKNRPLVTYDPNDSDEIKYKCAEKITAVKADDCSSLWVITHFTDSFYAFKVGVGGVNPDPVISPVGPEVPISGYRRNAIGYLKASPNGNKLAVAHFGFATTPGGDAPGGVYLFDFDNTTGIVSNSIELYGPQNGRSPYGVEFSAENRKVYATVNQGAGSQILQWDLNATDIPSSLSIVHTSSTIASGALQLGIDKRIYRAQLGQNNVERFLGVIRNPELAGVNAGYDEQGVLLDVNGSGQNISRFGLPPFIQSLFNTEVDIIQNGISTTQLSLCDGANYTLQADDISGADYTWFKDGIELTQETNFDLFVDTPGFYEVFIEPNNGECPIEGQALVEYFEIPVIAAQPQDIRACDTQTEFNLSLKDSEILGSLDPNTYQVKYFDNQADFNFNQNEISGLFTSTQETQTIFVRVENVGNGDCSDETSFDIIRFATPDLSQINGEEVCDQDSDPFDAITLFNLEDIAEDIINGLDLNVFSYSFHNALTDAENNISPIGPLYTNSNPVEELFIRVANNQEPDCFNITSFEITVNASPVVNNINIIQCDEDGIPEGFTQFNLLNHLDEISPNPDDNTFSFHLTFQDADLEQNEIDASNFGNFFNPQTLFARVTDSTTGCSNIAEITLEIAVTQIDDLELTNCDDDGTEDGFAQFDLTLVETELPAGLDILYYETYEDALLENSPLSTDYTNITPYSQTVYVRAENANACFGISELELIVFELPNVELEAETFYCLNTFPDTITLFGGIIGDDPSNYYYNWSTGDDESEIQVNAPGTYTVVVSNTDGCSKTRTVTVLPSSTAAIENVEVTDASPNNSITIIVSGDGDYEYALDNSTGPYQDSNTFEGVSIGFHDIYIRDKNGCGITTDLISVIGFPKFFTPNGDAFNPVWRVKGLSTQFQPNSLIHVYDRHGKLLAQLDPVGAGWDGTFNGRPMPSNDYWFSCTLEDGRTFKGHFTLKR